MREPPGAAVTLQKEGMEEGNNTGVCKAVTLTAWEAAEDTIAVAPKEER
jgi:hypothetical protein